MRTKPLAELQHVPKSHGPGGPSSQEVQTVAASAWLRCMISTPTVHHVHGASRAVEQAGRKGFAAGCFPSHVAAGTSVSLGGAWSPRNVEHAYLRPLLRFLCDGTVHRVVARMVARRSPVSRSTV